MPGTMTTSCLRTQAAVRPMSTSLPRPFRTIDRRPDAVSYSDWFQCRGVVSSPYRSRTTSGPPTRAPSTASGYSARR